VELFTNASNIPFDIYHLTAQLSTEKVSHNNDMIKIDFTRNPYFIRNIGTTQETGDRRQETGDRRQEAGGRRQETWP